MNMAAQLLEIPEATILQAIEAELEEGNLTADLIEGKDAVYLSALYRSETGCAKHLLRLLEGPLPWGSIDADKSIPWVEWTLC
jgi:exodeoxyribonuclease V alpha subunit